MSLRRMLRLLALAIVLVSLAGITLQFVSPPFEGSALFVVFAIVGVAMLIDLRPR